MQRSPRLPLEQAEFNELNMPICTLDPKSWLNLRFKAYATQENLFYANAGSRLTPYSLTIPCLYLAEMAHTAFLELYGDSLYAARLKKVLFTMTESHLDERVFVKVETSSLKLCDLTTKEGGLALHFDAGTLWAADFQYPQRFAEAIYHHPAAVDGIRYQSRHNGEVCLVVWNRRDIAKLQTNQPETLRAHTKATNIQTIRLFGEEMHLAGKESTFNNLLSPSGEQSSD